METPRNSDNYDISIHALRKESDKPFAKKFRWNAISIHALRKESDSAIGRRSSPCRHFNPRSP